MKRFQTLLLTSTYAATNRVTLGFHATEEAAAQAYKTYVAKHGDVSKLVARLPSQVVGVSWYPRKSRWMARPSVNGKEVYLGYHATIEEAAAGAYTCPLLSST